MSQFLDRLMFFRKNVEKFSDDWGVVTRESRSGEKGYRDRWNHDKIVRSTHGVNCTGSCSWKIYVKSGLITWETQQTDYPRTRPEIPQPRAARLSARGELLLVYLQRRAPQALSRALAPARALAGSAARQGAGCGVGLDRAGHFRAPTPR